MADTVDFYLKDIMRSQFAYIVCFVLLLVSIQSCSNQKTLKYPPSWPDPEITVPEGSMPAKYRHASLVGSENNGYLVTGNTLPNLDVFGVGFEYCGDRNEVHKHLDTILYQKGYKLYEENAFVRTYRLDNTDIVLYYDAKKPISYMLAIKIYHQ